MPNFWLSYADSVAFRGAVIMEGADDLDAVRTSAARGLSPGGQVVLVELDPAVAARLPAEYVGRLLTFSECTGLEALMDEATADLEP